MSRPITIKRHRSMNLQLKELLGSSVNHSSADRTSADLSAPKMRYPKAKTFPLAVIYQNARRSTADNVVADELAEARINLTCGLKERNVCGYRLRRSTCLKRPMFSNSEIQNLPTDVAQEPSKELQTGTTRHQSTKETAREDGAEEMFYNQVRFLQKCKEKATKMK